MRPLRFIQRDGCGNARYLVVNTETGACQLMTRNCTPLGLSYVCGDAARLTFAIEDAAADAKDFRTHDKLPARLLTILGKEATAPGEQWTEWFFPS